MSEPLKLSKVFGLERIYDIDSAPIHLGNYEASVYLDGANSTIDKLDQRKPDAEKLARIIYEQQYNRNININSRCPDWKKESPYVKERFFLLAQEIINKMSVWIVEKG